MSWSSRAVRMLIASLLAAMFVLPLSSATPAYAAGTLIKLVNTDKAMYSPGSTATIYVDLQNNTGSTFSGSVALNITHLGNVVANVPAAKSVSNLAVGASTSVSFTWTPPSTDFRGYQIDVTARNGSGSTVDTSATAIDVSSDWKKFPRYGYVSRFDSGIDTYNLMWQLKNYHINGIQFYDWMWKHHIPYSPNQSWPDVANRTIYRSTVTGFIDAAHSYNMQAMAYNLYGAAYDNYPNDGSGVSLSMGMFRMQKAAGTYTLADQYQIDFPSTWQTQKFYEMNMRSSAWQTYIFNRMRDVFNNFAFDGWHIDTLGARNAYDWDGNNFQLRDYYASFTNNAKSNLNKRMVFNTVNADGQNLVSANANVDFVYSELWDNVTTYAGLNQKVQESKASSDKAVVFPAYMNYNYSKNFSESSPGFFNEPGIRLADATIFAAGGSHVELGDGDKMLSHEYFPNINLRMSNSLKSAMANYYNFLVAYENLLRDGTSNNTTQVNVSNVATSTNGGAGTVWVLPKKRAGYDIVHLINLENNTSNEWRDTNGNYPAPDVFTNLPVKMYHRGTLNTGAKLFYATPDDQFGKATQLSYTKGSDSGGNYVTFTVPRLHYWDMIWLEVNDTTTGSGAPIGKTIWLKANANGKYVSAWNDTYRTLQARVDGVGTWERFQVVDAGGGFIALKATINNQYVSAWNDTNRTLQARVGSIGEWEKFQWVDAGGGYIALKANANNQYVSAWNDTNRTLQARISSIGEWEKFQWAEAP